MRFKNTFCITCVMGVMLLTACEQAESIHQNTSSVSHSNLEMSSNNDGYSPSNHTAITYDSGAFSDIAVTAPEEVYVGEQTVEAMQAHGEEFYAETLARIAAEQGQ